MAKIVIKDGVRYPEAFATRHQIEADETRQTGAERVRTTTAVGFVVDEVSGAVITSAAQGAPELTAAEKKAAAAAEKKAAAEQAAADKAAAEKAAADKAAAGKSE